MSRHVELENPLQKTQFWDSYRFVKWNRMQTSITYYRLVKLEKTEKVFKVELRFN